MHWQRGAASVRVPILAVGTALPDQDKAQTCKQKCYFCGLQDGRAAHALSNGYLSNTNELRVEGWLTILEQHRNDFAQICIQFVQRLAL